MVHAFLLILLLGDVKQGGQPMYFRDIKDCNYFASQIVKRYGNYGVPIMSPKNIELLAYCKPVYISSNYGDFILTDFTYSQLQLC